MQAQQQLFWKPYVSDVPTPLLPHLISLEVKISEIFEGPSEVFAENIYSLLASMCRLRYIETKSPFLKAPNTPQVINQPFV